MAETQSAYPTLFSEVPVHPLDMPLGMPARTVLDVAAISLMAQPTKFLRYCLGFFTGYKDSHALSLPITNTLIIAATKRRCASTDWYKHVTAPLIPDRSNIVHQSFPIYICESRIPDLNRRCLLGRQECYRYTNPT